MWLIDVMMLAVTIGGFIFWWNFIRRNISSTHRVVETHDYQYPYKVQKVLKIFGATVYKEDVACGRKFVEASRDAISREVLLKQRESAKNIRQIYEIQDLERLILIEHSKNKDWVQQKGEEFKQ